MGDDANPQPAEGARRPRVLVAEDDEEMRRLVAETLRRSECEVVEIEDGSQLVSFLARVHAKHDASPVDLIVSDIRMPGCNGLDLLEALRRLRWKVPVILMTAFGDEDARGRTSALGAVLFEKPFRLQDLQAAVQRWFPRSR